MDNDNRSSWYAPLERERDRAAQLEAAPKKRRGLPLGWRIALGTLLALGLIMGSSILFADRSLPHQPSMQPFEFPLPDSEAGMPDDWQEYFNSFFVTKSSDRKESRIPPVEERPEWELELQPPGDEEKSLQELYRDCVDSIVSIRCYVGGDISYFWGSGIILSEDGLILTNAHLVEDRDTAEVILQDNSEYWAELVGADTTSDLAVLKIKAKGLKPAVFGDSNCLSVGQGVAAIGNPLGEEFVATLTDGIISGIDRGIDYNGHSMSLLQTNTAINEGSSGGALLNLYGQVIGVTNMKMMSSYSSIEGICFAIPSATVRMVVNSLIREGKVMGRPAVGITVGAIPDQAAEFYELPEGLYVSTVLEESDAWKKGMRSGDIITAVNGEPARTTEDILSVVNGLQVGETVTFSVWREGESFDLDVAMVEFSDVY